MKAFSTAGLLAATLCLSGCATVATHRADPDAAPRGVRVYPPRIYLLVDAEAKHTTCLTLPDYSRGYDLQPISLLARQNFKIEIGDGCLTSLDAGQDTTALFNVLAKAVTAGGLAGGLTGGLAAAPDFPGSFGLVTGIYRLDDTGVFRRVSP